MTWPTPAISRLQSLWTRHVELPWSKSGVPAMPIHAILQQKSAGRPLHAILLREEDQDHLCRCEAVPWVMLDDCQWYQDRCHSEYGKSFHKTIKGTWTHGNSVFLVKEWKWTSKNTICLAPLWKIKHDTTCHLYFFEVCWARNPQGFSHCQEQPLWATAFNAPTCKFACLTWFYLQGDPILINFAMWKKHHLNSSIHTEIDMVVNSLKGHVQRWKYRIPILYPAGSGLLLLPHEEWIKIKTQKSLQSTRLCRAKADKQIL